MSAGSAQPGGPRPRPVLASFAAGAVWVAPFLLLMLSELIPGAPSARALDQFDDAPQRGTAAGLAAAPFLYVADVAVSAVAGRTLCALGMLSRRRFMAGATVLALVPGIVLGAWLGRGGAWPVPVAILISTVVFLVVTLPAAFCWWLIAVHPIFKRR